MLIKFEGTCLAINKMESNKITTTLESGENLNIIGPSGSGKSSYVNALIGLPSMLKGNVIIDGINLKIFHSSKWSIMRRKIIACVFQNLELFQDLSVADNIKIVTGLYKSIDESKKDFIIDSLNLNPFKNTKVKNLSLGEIQRLAICRALVRPFSLLILDEPFSHLDKDNIQKSIQLINQISNDNQAGLILTSHSESQDFAFDKTIVLQ